MHTRVKLHSRASGEERRLRILRVLASSTVPLSVRELVRRTGLPRRTLYYYLAQLTDSRRWGGRPLVRRVGRPRSPGVLYEITAAGRECLERARVKLECANSRRSRAGIRRGGCGCGRGRGPGVVLGRLVVQERADGGREVGVRVGFRAYREVLASLGVSGFDGRAPRRVKYSMFYVDGRGEGVVHFDHYTRFSRLDCVLAGLWAVRGRVLSIVVACFSIMKWYGYTESFVRELWRRTPRLELENRVYLEDGRGRVLGWWDPDVLSFHPTGTGLEEWLPQAASAAPGA